MKVVVYAIKNELGKIYIGQTEDLENRIDRHNKNLPSKKTSYTYKNSGDWILFYKEECVSREVAKKREKQLKSFRGREFLRSL